MRTARPTAGPLQNAHFMVLQALVTVDLVRPVGAPYREQVCRYLPMIAKALTSY